MPDETVSERVAQVVADTVFPVTLTSDHEETRAVPMRVGRAVASALLAAGLLSDEVLAEVWVSARLFGIGAMVRNEDDTYRSLDARHIQIRDEDGATPRHPPVPLDQVSSSLLDALRALGDEYGPLGVAIVAGQLTDSFVLMQQLAMVEQVKPGGVTIPETFVSDWPESAPIMGDVANVEHPGQREKMKPGD